MPKACKNCGGPITEHKDDCVFCPVCGWFAIDGNEWTPCERPQTESVTVEEGQPEGSSPIPEPETPILDEKPALSEKPAKEQVTHKSLSKYTAPALLVAGVITLFMARTIGLWSKQKQNLTPEKFPRLSQ
jgi:uncharacterized Zn finger protein (UPF0148 family)